MNGKRFLICLAAAALAGLIIGLPFLAENRPMNHGLTAGWLLPAAAGMALLLYGAGFFPESFHQRRRVVAAAIAALSSRRPVAALALVAALAVCASTYPVVFGGRSFVSPGYGGVYLLYNRPPFLPGAWEGSIQSAARADTSVILWQDIPYLRTAFVSLRSGVFPLWNRFNSAGVSLLGQGQSMLGSPLHLPVILAGGNSFSWDAVFLGSKWLLALGFALVVWELTRHLPSAALTAFASAFIGFFTYRINHPAIFSLCVAPWMLYAWTRIARARSLRSVLAWTAFLLLAAWAELTSGTVKEAWALLLSANVAGALLVTCSRQPRKFRLHSLCVVLAAGMAFVLLAAPLWMTFFETLGQSYTNYEDVPVLSAPPALLIGFFDELFYRPLSPVGAVFCPAVNFLLLLGGLYFIATLGRRIHDRSLLALAGAGLVPFALAFGLIPAGWIRAVPLLRNIGHIHNTFSCVLILLFIPVAGAGYHAAWRRLGTVHGPSDVARILSLLGILLSLFFAGMLWPDRLLSLPSGTGLSVDGFIFGSLVALGLAACVLLWTVSRILRAGNTTVVTGLLAVACLTAMLWRQGMHSGFEGERYVFRGAPRVDLYAPSAAVEAVQADRSSPFRVGGIEGNMLGGWHGMYGLEGISGPDALMNRQYHELLNACGVDRQWDWYWDMRVETIGALRPVFDFLNVRYYFASAVDNIPPEAGLAEVAQADLRVFRSNTAWPRAFFTNRVLLYASVPELAALIRGSTGHPFAAIQDGDPGDLPARPEDGIGSIVVLAEDYRLDPNSTSFKVRTTGPGMIVLQECWMKDSFQATLDGVPVACLRVNHAFKGIRVESPGLHRVTFSYRPHYWTLALWLHLSGWFLVAAGWVGYRRLPAPAPGRC
jgi:hypothetical protein